MFLSRIYFFLLDDPVGIGLRGQTEGRLWMDRTLYGQALASWIFYCLLCLKDYGMMRRGVRQPFTPLPMCLLNRDVILHPHPV